MSNTAGESRGFWTTGFAEKTAAEKLLENEWKYFLWVRTHLVKDG